MWQHQFSGFDNALPLFTGIWGSWVISTIYFLWVYNFLYTIFHNFLRVYHFRGKKVKRHANWKFQVFWKDLAAFGVTGWFSRKIDTFIWNSQGTLFRLTCTNILHITQGAINGIGECMVYAWYKYSFNLLTLDMVPLPSTMPEVIHSWRTLCYTLSRE